MKTDVQRTWQASLKSDNFCQGTSYLRVFNRKTGTYQYCCLGVLCELSGLGEWVLDRYDEDRDWDVYSYLGETQYLPLEVAQWADIDTSHGAEESDQCFFVDLNDSEDYDFPMISDEIAVRYRVA